MPVTVNLRNDSSSFIKISGIDEVIVPNSEIEDKTIQWVSNDNKIISVFSNEACDGTAICVGSLTFLPNDGIIVERGEISGVQSIKLESDVTNKFNRISQVDNESGGKLIEWSDVNDETVINLTFLNN